MSFDNQIFLKIESNTPNTHSPNLFGGGNFAEIPPSATYFRIMIPITIYLVVFLHWRFRKQRSFLSDRRKIFRLFSVGAVKYQMTGIIGDEESALAGTKDFNQFGICLNGRTRANGMLGNDYIPFQSAELQAGSALPRSTCNIAGNSLENRSGRRQYSLLRCMMMAVLSAWKFSNDTSII